MPRRREVPKRVMLPDPKFKDQTVAKFINVIMLDGKKSIAEGIIYGALDIIQDRGAEKPLDIFYQALENIRPVVEVKSRRVGGRPTRCQLKFGPVAVTRSLCAG